MKLTTTTMVSVDGVMQGLGGPDEDRRGGFECGGWAAPLFDEEAAAVLGQIYGRADAFLFGRWTYEVFAGSWGAVKRDPARQPRRIGVEHQAQIRGVHQAHGPEVGKDDVLSGDVAAAVRELKAKPGGELQVHGSGKLERWLFDNDLVDEINLHTYPLVLGQARGSSLRPARTGRSN